MKTRALSIREKNMGVMVLALCFIIIGWGAKSRWSRKAERAREEVSAVQDRLEQTKKLLATAPTDTNAGASPIEVVIDRHSSLFLLRDLTAPDLAHKVTVIGATRGTNGEYQIEVEGEFQELMRFMSFLERRDGKFLLHAANFRRANQLTPGGASPADAGRIVSASPSRKVQATFNLTMKG